MGCICCDDMEVGTIGLDELVRASIAFLDGYGPEDWRTRISAVDLDINSTEDCVLGQIYGRYSIGIDELGINYDDPRYAFMSINYTPEDMQDEWLKQLAM